MQTTLNYWGKGTVVISMLKKENLEPTSLTWLLAGFSFSLAVEMRAWFLAGFWPEAASGGSQMSFSVGNSHMQWLPLEQARKWEKACKMKVTVSCTLISMQHPISFAILSYLKQVTRSIWHSLCGDSTRMWIPRGRDHWCYLKGWPPHAFSHSKTMREVF